jgi:hypothetical protein
MVVANCVYPVKPRVIIYYDCEVDAILSNQRANWATNRRPWTLPTPSNGYTFVDIYDTFGGLCAPLEAACESCCKYGEKRLDGLRYHREFHLFLPPGILTFAAITRQTPCSGKRLQALCQSLIDRIAGRTVRQRSG